MYIVLFKADYLDRLGTAPGTKVPESRTGPYKLVTAPLHYIFTTAFDKSSLKHRTSFCLTMSSKAHILTIGGGGVGTIVAYNIEEGGLATSQMVLRSNYDTVVTSGFSIESCDHGTIHKWKPAGGVVDSISSAASLGQVYDYIICCTKNNPDAPPPSLVDIVRPVVTPDRSVIILIQNGLNIEKPYIEAFPTNVVLSGVSLCGSTEIAPGRIIHNDADKLLVGYFPNANIDPGIQIRAAEEFVRIYKASGRVEVQYDSDVIRSRWRKLIYNTVYNPICALTDLDSSRLRLFSMPEMNGTAAPSFNFVETLIRPAMLEVCEAAKAAAGVEFQPDVVDLQVNAESIDGFILTSMQQDARKGRLLECEAILGEALREGEQAGVSMPVVRTLYSLCKGYQFRVREKLGMLPMTLDEAVTIYKK
ncbi:hypothetical protein TSTA_012360 [Talaromyces stipitatus ATCC 10500]|uniref:2-dehydropantoate 2-reductase n=1 Tax=Talaromyces stipitatus (strain ATCC 10500 / CBS 375.48 / QM 6759 / NRRL 1006) TaxID=441959 RepID=B8MF28_TALSN|nr:uncharacterized protein TSTA_012360 [Talaromyces stipitatus ATCC 10500]EED16127.1 hypothetical protein TSTA_012360 [Talaromyces stipitatus ATCC 10500]